MEHYKELHIEEDFWNDFVQEAFEHIEEIETNVITLEQNPDNMEIIHTMFRAYHTIKGLSGFVEHTVIQEVAHKTETLMDYCRKGELKVTTKIVDAILKSSDYIKRLCEEVDSYKDESFMQKIDTLLETLEKLANIGEESTPDTTEIAINKSQEAASEEIVTNSSEVNIDAFIEETNEFIDTQEHNEKNEATKGEEAPAKKPSEKKAVKTPKAKGKTENKPEVKAEVQIETQPAVKIEEKEIIQKEEIKTDTVQSDSDIRKNQPPEEHMKVANSKIDHLVDMIGELIINQSLLEQHITHNYSNDNQLTANMSGFLRTTRELQNLSMSLRMVSLKQTFQKLTRIARDTIQELNKDVEFIISGENTEIDRVVTDKLLDPLVHMIKNAISHGIEPNAQDRVKFNKPKKAKVELNAYNKRGKIFIEVKDDGRGINTEVVYKKALEKGIIDPNVNYSDSEIKEFIMLPGFSTAEVVDNISGRGVGMDVVRTQILKIGGKVEIQSELNKGSTFTLEVPVNHAIMNGTIIEMQDQIFIVPTINVKEILQPTENQWISTQQKRTMLRVRDNIISIVPMSLFFKDKTIDNKVPLVMLLELDGELRALPITNVLNRQEVVVKPVGEEFLSLKYISGMSILGTGKVSLILDIDYLFKKEVKE